MIQILTQWYTPADIQKDRYTVYPTHQNNFLKIDHVLERGQHKVNLHTSYPLERLAEGGHRTNTQQVFYLQNTDLFTQSTCLVISFPSVQQFG